MTTFSLSYLLIITTICILINPDPAVTEDWGKLFVLLERSFSIIFSLLFFSLISTVIVLIRKLRSNNRIFGNLGDEKDSENLFAKEINSLTVILVSFSLSYLLREVYDVAIWFKIENENTFAAYTLRLVASIPFDLAPIYVLLWLHRKNL